MMPDREKVLTAMECCAVGAECDHCPYSMLNKEGHEGCYQMHWDALKLLKQPEQKWIPVTEALPKNMANKVLVYLDHEYLVGYIGYGHFERYNGTETWYDLEHYEPFANGYFVTHWMPLPEAPKQN